MITIKQRIKAFFDALISFSTTHKKTSILTLIIIGLVLFVLVRGKTDSQTVVTDTVKQRDLRSTVLATGQVTSVTDLGLSFKSSDVVRSLKVSVGDKVVKDQILATLDNQDELGSLTQAQGALKLAQASLKRTLEGATNEEIAVMETALRNAQVDLENTKRQQATLVANAYRAMLNAGLEIKLTSTEATAVSLPVLSGTYASTQTGKYTISTYSTGTGGYFTYTGLESGSGPTDKISAISLGSRGLFLTFPTNFGVGTNDTHWEVTIPNVQSSTYLTYSNAYSAALETEKNAVSNAQAIVDARQADLNLKKAQARPADIDAREADVLSAQGRVQSAQAAYENTILRAPAPGTITAVDIKVGELASVQKEVMTLQDVSSLYLEANINEANISSIKIGQPIEVTFDAFGPDQKFTAIVSQIDPASTIVSGVVNYKIKASLPTTLDIKPGMTANMIILIKENKNTLVVPTRAIVEKDGRKIIRVITDTKKKTFTETSVTLGLEGDDGTEILAGVQAGQEIVVLLDTTKK